jgi:IS30 family transposase
MTDQLLRQYAPVRQNKKNTTMSYQQLTVGQRYQISIMHRQQYSASHIARLLGVHRSTIYRELKRNSYQDSYDPEQAHTLANKRKLTARKYCIDNRTQLFVEMTLAWQWSPEQISGVGALIGLRVSHEWIYRFVARDKARGGKLYKQLRQSHRRYRKGRNNKRAPIVDPRSIDDRPEIVDTRSRLGEWEVDTVLGEQGSGALVTLAERKSKLFLVRKVPDKTAESVTKAVINMLKPYQRHVLTITADNGTEFAHHKRIEKALSAKVYFAHPYSAWERGLNENFNGLLRQYIPKGTDLRQVSHHQVRACQKALNSRPRKCLGFKQPSAVFEALRQAA